MKVSPACGSKSRSPVASSKSKHATLHMSAGGPYLSRSQRVGQSGVSAAVPLSGARARVARLLCSLRTVHGACAQDILGAKDYFRATILPRLDVVREMSINPARVAKVDNLKAQRPAIVQVSSPRAGLC